MPAFPDLCQLVGSIGPNRQTLCTQVAAAQGVCSESFNLKGCFECSLLSVPREQGVGRLIVQWEIKLILIKSANRLLIASDEFGHQARSCFESQLYSFG